LEEGQGRVDVEPRLTEVRLDVLHEGRRRDAPALRHPLRLRRRRHKREHEGRSVRKEWPGRLEEREREGRRSQLGRNEDELPQQWNRSVRLIVSTYWAFSARLR
jgi:hypothetical protein